MDLIDDFYDKIVNAVNSYKLPAITVLKSTPSLPFARFSRMSIVAVCH